MAKRKTKESDSNSDSQAKTAHDPRAFLPMENCNFDILDVAGVLKISRASVYELIGKGLIKPVHFGRRSIVPGVELVRVVKAFAAGELLPNKRNRTAPLHVGGAR